MKKILIATTAIATLGMAGGAVAAEWSAGVNGYMQIGVGFDGTQDGVGILRDGEIHFNANMTADNGLTFKARVELEATTASDQIDENWASVGGSFGTVKIGGDDSAKNAYNNGVIYAPGARIGYYDGFGLFRNTSQPGIAGAGDQIGIHYDSPSFMGFRFGATYRPEASTDGAGGDRGGSMAFEQDLPGDEFYAFGAVYDGNFGDFGFGISAGYADADSTSDVYHIAGNVSFSGFTIAGGYENQTDDEFYIGARYETGPWTIAGGYSNQSLTGKDTSVGSGWITYALAPGVRASAGLEYEDSATVDEEIAGLAYLQLNF